MQADEFNNLELLPIRARRDDILTAVAERQVTIITAETGAGKSTQVPQYLAEQGYSRIIVTQPRILAARNLSDRVRQEYTWRRGKDSSALVGYRTAHERDDDPDTVILYCTDGLQLVRELTGGGTGDNQILILDEVHEWNENMEVLVAWAKKRCREDPAFKVVLMSATIDSTSLAAFFNAALPISVPGRSYPVTKHESDDLLRAITDILEKHVSNMLVFLPGKAEIESVAEALHAQIGSSIPIIPLHSQLEPEVQQLAFASYPNGKIILATNIAQTSITIDDIDVVIDSGLERRSEVRQGVEGLFIAEISQADCLQRAGRAGRTKPGTYILAKLGVMPCTPLDKRADYGVPEILRKHIDRLVLRLANIGINIEDLDFYHSPSRKTIALAKRTLINLGALTPSQQVTPIGRQMERYPVESSYARMLVEAAELDAGAQNKMAAIIAIQEVGGIVKGGPRYSGWRKCCRQNRSDLVAQYEVYLALNIIDEADYEDLGIIPKNIDKAAEVYERLAHDLGVSGVPLSPITDQEIDGLLKCIVAGQLHQIWAVEDDGQAVHLQTNSRRELSSTTVVKQASLVAGTPFDLQVPSGGGLETLHLVNGLTSVDPAWLSELMPELYTYRPGKMFFDPRYGTLAAKSRLQYGHKKFDATSTPVLEQTADNRKQFIIHYAAWVHEEINKERARLQAINHRKIPEVSVKQVQEHVRRIAPGVVSLIELSKGQQLALTKLTKLESYIGAQFMDGLIQTDSGRQHHKARRGSWKFHPGKHFSRKKDH